MVAVQGDDQDRRVIYWNSASERLYGYSRDEAMGGLLEELIIPEHMHDLVIELTKDWVERDVAIPAAELELKHKDGSGVPVYSSHVMQTNSQGHKEMYCVDIDLSEIKEAHAQLVRAKEQAESANKAKSLFLANMSHELRTPLNGIMGMLQLMQTTSLSQEQNEYSQAAIHSSQRLTRLLSDILDLSRVEAGKLSIQSVPFDPMEPLRQVQDLFAPAVRQSGLSLICHTDPKLPSMVLGDVTRLQQVLNNLVGNAFKFTSSGGVFLEASLLPSSTPNVAWILFVVSDTGIGIPEDRVGALFESFTQVKDAYTRSDQGAGLGLSICKHLILLMGGSLCIDSQIGQGTSVHFSLPLGLAHPVPEALPHEDTVLAHDLGKEACRVLLVEDDRVSTIAATRLLEKANCRVTAVSDGKQALDVLRTKPYDVVLMDVQLPVMNGVETTLAIRKGKAGKENIAVPIIALTAYAMSGDKEALLLAGMDDYLPKPIELAALQQKLQSVVRRES